ncbi:MAG TPA: OB-fold domain-containing protein [Aeromicrobium sp.]|nr:OB-fold domain-containing protein [Aeromicrobium sp.]HKY58989.1 OB-fold domain-containing protein [Aeromicrobium sp.]
MSRTLEAPVTVAFDYTRSVGPVLGRFFTGLRDRQLVGARLSDGRIAVPPPEFDPVNHAATTDFVDVSDHGVVTSWTWVSEPVAGQPLTHPFAFALVTLDGASTPMLHAVDAGSPEKMHTGMRVQARWNEETIGVINDFVFVPEGSVPDSSPAEPGDEITGIITPVSLDYRYAASPEESAFFRGLAEGRILGQRCPTCRKVYVPPRPACPVDGVPTAEEIELGHNGTVTTFCIVNVPFLGQKITPPYVSAYILLDGADIALQHLILDIPADEVRMGLRVKAVWRPREEWGTTIENISHFAPSGEPDADYDTYKHHL